MKLKNTLYSQMLPILLTGLGNNDTDISTSSSLKCVSEMLSWKTNKKPKRNWSRDSVVTKSKTNQNCDFSVNCVETKTVIQINETIHYNSITANAEINESRSEFYVSHLAEMKGNQRAQWRIAIDYWLQENFYTQDDWPPDPGLEVAKQLRDGFSSYCYLNLKKLLMIFELGYWLHQSIIYTIKKTGSIRSGCFLGGHGWRG